MEKEFAVPVAAFVAAAASVAVGHPFDTIKTRMQTKKNSSLLNSIKEIHRNGGIPSFYAGVAPVLISVSVLRALSFSIYSHSSKLYSPNDLQSLIIVSAFSGAVTGTLVSTLNAPFEFIKVQRQLFTSTSTSDLLKHTFKTKGPMFLYTAAHLHILRDSLHYISVFMKLLNISPLQSNKNQLH